MSSQNPINNAQLVEDFYQQYNPSRTGAGIAGVGVGEGPTLVVMVESTAAKTQLESSLPKDFQGIPIKIIVTGKFEAF